MAAIGNERLASLAKVADLFAWDLEGSCGFADFQWWKDGAKVRHWRELEGQTQIDIGSPLFDDDKGTPAHIDSQAHVFEAMAAVSIPIDKIYERELIAYAFPPSSWS